MGPTGPAADRGRPTALLVTLALVGALVSLWLQSRVGGAAGFTALAVMAVALVGFGAARTGSSRVLLGAAMVPAGFLALRSSLWLTLPNAAAALTLLALGAGFAKRGSLVNVSFTGLLRRLLLAQGGVMLSPAFLVSMARTAGHSRVGWSRRSLAIARGLVLAAPVVAVLGLLLASGDAMFASLLSISIDPTHAIAHGAVVLIGAILAGGLFVLAGMEGVESRGGGLRIGATEAAVVLGGLIGVYALFAGSRVLVALKGSAYVLERTGLGYADYARGGFFQLLWAAGVTLVVLIGLRSTVTLNSATARRGFAAGSLTAVALTLVVVQTAIARLDLYEQAFGSTMLRLFCVAFAWWVGAVFVLVGASALIPKGQRRLPAAVLCSGLIALTAVNAINPESVVAGRNVHRLNLAAGGEPESGGPSDGPSGFDAAYAITLGDDATPTLVEALPKLTPADRRALSQHLCFGARSGDDTRNDDHTGNRDGTGNPDHAPPTPWNLGSLRARAALEDLCG